MLGLLEGNRAFIGGEPMPFIVPAPQDRPIAYESFRRGRAYYHCVRADVTSGRVETRTAFVDGRSHPRNLAQDFNADVAITGTFFAPQNGTPVADVLVNGHLAARGNRGSVLAVDPSGNVTISDKGFKRRFDWSGYKHGLRGAVRLVTKGKVHPNPRAQAFKDPRIWGRAARTGVGLTKSGKLILMATSSNVTLSEFGKAMVSRGAVEALSLDGGGSTCLFYRGKMVVPTGRHLSNMLVLREVTTVAQR